MYQLDDTAIVRYTTERDIFKTMQTACLLINNRMYREKLADPKHVDSWPALRLAQTLVEDELKTRGIEITK